MINKVLLFLVLFSASVDVISQESFFEKGGFLCSQGKASNPTNILHSRSLNSPRHKYDVLNYTLDFDLYNNFLFPYSQAFSASETITFRVDTALSQIKLNAVNTSIQVLNVGLDGASFTHSQDTLTIDLDRMFNAGEIVDVSIIYDHADVEDKAFYCNDGFVFTDNEPEGARKWFPCYDHPADKATLDLTANVPAGALLGSNGLLMDSTTIADTTSYHWVSGDPIATYLMVISASANWNLDIIYWPTLSNPDSLVPMRFYYNPGTDPTSMELLLPEMCTYFSEHYGEHPFEKNGFAALNNEFGWAGMENQSLTSICKTCWYESLICHEFAHQWFGDMISPGTWADLWLNEGFAQWSEAFWYESSGGYASYKNDIDYNASYYLQVNPGWAIYVPEWAITTPDNDTLFNYAITYCKSACVLHLLRYSLGDSLFFPALYNYATDTANFKYKNAITDDFQASFEESTGQDLDWFFNSWVKQPNHPVYNNEYNIQDNGDGTWNVNFYVNQIQTNAGFFPIPIEVYILFMGGTDTIMRVMNDYNQQWFTFTFNVQPTDVIFDFNNEIVLKQASLVVGMDDGKMGYNTFLLSQNYPNPVINKAKISYTLPVSTSVQLFVYDLNGRQVLYLVDEVQEAGVHEVQVNVSTLPPGVYTYQLLAGMYCDSKKMVVVK